MNIYFNIYFIQVRKDYFNVFYSVVFFLICLLNAYIATEIAAKRKNIRLLLKLFERALTTPNTKHPIATIIQTISRKWTGFLFIFFNFKCSGCFFNFPVCEILIGFKTFSVNYPFFCFYTHISVRIDYLFHFVPDEIFCV